MAIHAYRYSGPETLTSNLLLADWMIRHITGRTIPIWITEWGYSLGYINSTDGHSDSFRQYQAVKVSGAAGWCVS